MKIKVVKSKDVERVSRRSKKYAELLIKYDGMADDETLKVEIAGQGQATSINQLFKRRGIKAHQRSINGQMIMLIPKGKKLS